ncbi:hypothetical protein B0H19DRAFT_1236723 [Mycena capillaripes]|nr:hypothetical protein B0H19DRAFT_1236723 [Mycena capillaripes]
MVRLVSCFFTVCLAIYAAGAPLQQRQVGNARCQLDRVKIVASLKATDATISKIPITDPATASAVSTAQAGLESASNAIQAIGADLQNGLNASASDRNNVFAGLTAAQTALSGITDVTANATVTAALTRLSKTLDAGKAVVANCN